MARRREIVHLERWLKTASSEGQSRTCGITVKNNWFVVRLTQYFENQKDGLDARGEDADLAEAIQKAILHFHQLLWKSIVRRSGDTKLNHLKEEKHDLLLKEMKEVQKKDFANSEFLKKPEYREKIFKNFDVLELTKLSPKEQE